MPLTDKECRNAKAAPKVYRMNDSRGLYLEVSPTGGRYWRYKYKFLKKEKRVSLGVYPNTSLAEARNKRDAARKMLSEGVEPCMPSITVSIHKWRGLGAALNAIGGDLVLVAGLISVVLSKKDILIRLQTLSQSLSRFAKEQ